MNSLSPNDRHKLDNFNGMTVGTIFQKSREAQNATILQVSEHLNIGSAHIEAIENNDIDHLPPKVYAVGFVRAYADLLGLDAEKMAYLFKVQVYGKKQTEQQKEIIKTEGKSLKLHDMILANRAVIPVVLAVLIFISLIVTVIAYFVMWMMAPSDRNDQFRVPEVPAEMLEGATQPLDEFVADEEADSPIEPMDMMVKADEGAKSYGVEPLESALAFKMVAEGWLEIRTVKNGEILLSETLNKGDVFYLPETQDILLTTNNAAYIEAYLDGEKLGLLGAEGDIIRLRPFSVKALRLQRGK